VGLPELSVPSSEEIDGNLRFQTRAGQTFEIDMTIVLGGGISKVAGAGGTEFYVFRDPMITEWSAEVAD
jgi:hypothetical protein